MYLLSQEKKTVIPGVNMITNTGYSNQATFTSIDKSLYSNLISEAFKLNHNSFNKLLPTLEMDYYLKIENFAEEFSQRNQFV